MMGSITFALDAFCDRIIPLTSRRDAEVFRRARRVAIFDVAFLFWVVAFAAVFAGLGSLQCALVTLLMVIPILASLVALERGCSPALCGNLLCIGGWAILTALALVSGGLDSPPNLWFSCLPVVAVSTAGMAWGIVWTLIPLTTIAAFVLAQALGLELPTDLSPGSLDVLFVAVLAALVVCQFILASVRAGVEQRALTALRDAKRQLTRARKDLATLQAGFGFSMADWAKVQREKAALERLVRYAPEDQDLDDDDSDTEDSDLEDAEAADGHAHQS